MAAVACLRLQHSYKLPGGAAAPTTSFLCDIFPNDRFEMGRKDFEDIFQIAAPNISTHHLRFHCIVYEPFEGGPPIAPMVYVSVISKNPVRLTRYGSHASCLITSRGPAVLLDHGDVLQLAPTSSIEFVVAAEHADLSPGLGVTQEEEIQALNEQHEYRITSRRLGVGGHASVFVAIEKHTQRQVAAKITPVPFTNPTVVDKLRANLRMSLEDYKSNVQKIKDDEAKRQENLVREYTVLKELNHPNIIALEKVLYTTKNVYIFQELITGGDLLSYLDREGPLPEPRTAVIVRQVLKAVDYLHDHDVVHRDIKPENVLMTSWRDGARVVLTDFGQARSIDDDKAAKPSHVFRMQSVCGTIGYSAPEILQYRQTGAKREDQLRGYSKVVDVWSVGCITAVCLTGSILFPDAPDSEELEQGIVAPTAYDASIIDTAEYWQPIGRKAKSFLHECVAEEGSRMTAKEALRHVWFTNRHYADELEAAYQRAIKDWTPRQHDVTISELDTKTICKSQPRAKETTKSHHFVDGRPVLASNSLFFGSKKDARIQPPELDNQPDTVERVVEQTVHLFAKGSNAVLDLTEDVDMSYSIGTSREDGMTYAESVRWSGPSDMSLSYPLDGLGRPDNLML